jgi:putative membrane protein
VSDTPPRGPRLITDEDERPAARLDFGWEEQVAPPAVAKERRRWSALSLGAAGLGVLLVGLSLLDVANFVHEQFLRATWLGAVTLVVALLGYGLIAWAFLRELRGLWQLRHVDKARAAFARGDYVAAREETLDWAARTPAARDMIPALRGANDLDSMVALLEAGPLRELDKASTAAGRAAAVQAAGAIVVMPTPALDAVFFVWRGFRLVREVAAIHGLRPGVSGTLGLLRRALFEAGAVAAADVAIDAATQFVATHPLVKTAIGESGKGAVAARRMILLARATARACRIVPPKQ